MDDIEKKYDVPEKSGIFSIEGLPTGPGSDVVDVEVIKELNASLKERLEILHRRLAELGIKF